MIKLAKDMTEPELALEIARIEFPTLKPEFQYDRVWITNPVTGDESSFTLENYFHPIWQRDKEKVIDWMVSEAKDWPVHGENYALANAIIDVLAWYTKSTLIDQARKWLEWYRATQRRKP